MEKAHYDIDLKAKNAVVDMFKSGVMVSQLQKAFSVGAFGIEKNRRFVPTRWSITAVDSTLGEHLMNFTKQKPRNPSHKSRNPIHVLLEKFNIFKQEINNSKGLIFMIPGYRI